MKNLGKYVRKKKLEDGREECRILVERKEKNTEKKERNKYYQNRVYQKRSGKIKSKRKMEWKGQKHGQARRKGKNQRIQIQQEVWEIYDRGNSGVAGERKCKRKKNDGEIYRFGRRRKKVQNVMWGERDNWAHGGMDVAKWERGRERNRERIEMERGKG
jgi:hypothetical protein